MRWDNLRLDESAEEGGGGSGGLFERSAVTRTFDTPGFRGMTFYEVHAKSVINRVPAASRMSFRWTINPYRGCSHACVYCFARSTHSYLDFDTGRDFDTRVVVKVNAPQRVRQELAAPRWRRAHAGEHIAMGTNVDPYQRAEGRYRLMPGIIEALRDAANPFSVLTKGTLILRDLDLLREAAEITEVAVNVSVGFTDHDLWRTLEPGAPNPGRRLEVCSALSEAGLGCGVLMGPIVPFLTDSPQALDTAVGRIAQAGATHVVPIVLHLRPNGPREWFHAWLAAHHPELVPRYQELYGQGAYAPKAYQSRIAQRVRALADKHGVGAAGPAAARRIRPPTPEEAEAVATPQPTQLALM